MDNIKNFYEIKNLAMKDFENNICLEFNDLEQYFQKYYKLYQMYDFIDNEQSSIKKEKILTNVKILIDTHKNKIKSRLHSDHDNLIEISNEYSNFIANLLYLQEKYPKFKEIIEIDDIV